MMPRTAACRCMASRRWDSTAEKYWTLYPAQRRRFCQSRSTALEKCIASNAADR